MRCLCGKLSKAPVSVVPRGWAVMRTFREECAVRYLCNTCKDRLLFVWGKQ